MAHSPLVYSPPTAAAPQRAATPQRAAATQSGPVVPRSGHPVPDWWRGHDPDVERIHQLHERGMWEQQIAAELGISKRRVVAALTAAGITRGTRARVPCPLPVRQLRAAARRGQLSAGRLAREHGVSHATAARWLVDAGVAPSDPDLPAALLHQLYVEQGKTTRQIAEQLHIPRARVIRAIAAAGIPARTRTARHHGGNRAAVTDDELTRVYLHEGMTLDQAAEHFAVTPAYLSSRIHELGLVKRPGHFTPRSPYQPAELQRLAAELYETGLNVHQIGQQLGVSGNTVANALHLAQVPMRLGGYRGADAPPRTLIDDLYADPDIIAVLHRHHVRRPTGQRWTPATPWESYTPLPLDQTLIRTLYVDIGLAMGHIAMLCGIGTTAVRNRLLQLGIPLRPSREPCPWNQRRNTSPPDPRITRPGRAR